MARKLKEEPFVPIGAGLTVAALLNAYRAMRRGDSHQVQRMFRARVAAQAFTVAAMVAGGWYYQADREKRKELREAKHKRDEEEKRQKWIRELEIRDAEDKAIQEHLDKRRKKAEARKAAAAAGNGEEDTQPGVAAQARAAFQERKLESEAAAAAVAAEQAHKDEELKNQGSVLGSLGGWIGGSKKPEDTPKDSETPEGDSTK